jgi:formylglycine-generating enzyme required for sulfatase activity
MVRAAVIILLIALLPSPLRAEARIALVIGNSAYLNTAKLTNPRNDAADMAAALKKLGFQLIEGFDLDKAALDRKIRDFATALQGADMGGFFYAGHGLQVAGQNYIVPVDAKAETASALDFEMVRLDLVQRTMEREAPTNILFLDACRNNPLARNLARALGTRSTEVGRGLAPVESGSGTLISFSTQPGNVAADGSGRNSPFTGPLVSHLATSNDDLGAVLIAVRNDVMNATQRTQVPWEHSALTKRVYFNPAPQTVAPPPAAARSSDAAEAWAAAKDTNSVDVLEDFIRRYKDTFYAGLARARIDELKRQQVAVVVPPKAPEPAPRAKPALTTPPTPPPARCDGIEITVGQNERRCFKPGAGKTEHFKDCPACPEMVVIPAGSFTMGSPANEPERSGGEEQARVSIAAPFAVGKYAVTFDEWDACVADGGCNGYKPEDQGWGRGKHPVINVNWDDAKAYTAWLSRKTGKTYRLLSEAEREYVTRAGTTTPFWWGSSITPQQANFDGNYTYAGGGSKGEFRQRTVPVDSFQPNPWGLYQVHGNVWERMEDCWNDSNAGNPGDGRERTTGTCTQRALRGGSFDDVPRLLRSAFHGGFTEITAGDRVDSVGFRLARTLNP